MPTFSQNWQGFRSSRPIVRQTDLYEGWLATWLFVFAVLENLRRLKICAHLLRVYVSISDCGGLEAVAISIEGGLVVKYVGCLDFAWSVGTTVIRMWCFCVSCTKCKDDCQPRVLATPEREAARIILVGVALVGVLTSPELEEVSEEQILAEMSPGRSRSLENTKARGGKASWLRNDRCVNPKTLLT